jgi:hypothetical protein
MNNEVFNVKESTVAKESGIARAASPRKAILQRAREIARKIAGERGEVYMDLVSRQLINEGITREQLGNAAGAVFKTSEWVWTTRIFMSEAVERQRGTQRIWKLA